MDLIANMISTIKNASQSGKPSIEVRYSKLCEAVAKVLEKEGFVAGVKVFKAKDTSVKGLHIDLAYDAGQPKVTTAKRVSKFGRRVYASSENLSKLTRLYGVSVISTSQGVMDAAEARKRKLGGEVLCSIY